MRPFVLALLVLLVIASGCVTGGQEEDAVVFSQEKAVSEPPDFDPIDEVKSSLPEGAEEEPWYSKGWKKEETGEGWKVSVDSYQAVWMVKADGSVCSDGKSAREFSGIPLCEGEEEPKPVSNTKLSGDYEESQVWSGNITITGDTTIHGSLEILPGTTVMFEVQDDQQGGNEVEADGFNDLDPTRLRNYEISHSSLNVLGKLTAVGRADEPITFTSAAGEPKYADWIAVQLESDGSEMRHCIVDWSRNGITIGRNQPNTMVKNCVINHTFWGAVSVGWSGAQIINNEIWEAGHEGIDVQGGDARIEGNRIQNAHAGIVILRGSSVVRNNMMKDVGSGIHVGGEATPTLEDNTVELAPSDSKLEWGYGSFVNPLFGEPEGTPLFTEVYENRYAVAGYRIEGNRIIELPASGSEWLLYGLEDGVFHQLEADITGMEIDIQEGYSLYVLIPGPTESERDQDTFNSEHGDIQSQMAV